jgi:hypothetical protein
VVTGYAASEAAAVKRDLTSARHLLARASSGSSDAKLSDRIALLDRSALLTRHAYSRARGFPLGPLGAIPYLGRDFRVAGVMARTADEAVRAARGAVTSVAELEGSSPDAAKLQGAVRALDVLHRKLDEGVREVEATPALIASRRARSEFLTQARSARGKTASASTVVDLAARLYGPAGTARYFLAFQNPAELRGTGGLIGQYGILESTPSGPRLGEVKTIHTLEARVKKGVALPADLVERYGRFFPQQVWTSVNVSPDMPTMSRTLLDLYQATSGELLDGVIAIDPEAAAAILDGRGRFEVEGVVLDASSLVRTTTIDAYVRFANDNDRRVRFLGGIARHTFDALMEGFRTDSTKLARSLATVAKGRHLMVYSSEPKLQGALESLGIAGEASAPTTGDYLMPVGVNTGGNKLDAFLHRSIGYTVRLAADGSANATVWMELKNTAVVNSLPRYIVGPVDERFRAGDAWLFQSVYVADGYDFTAARLGNRIVGAEAQHDLGALAISREIVVPAGKSSTVTYELVRREASTVNGGRMVYRLLVRPQVMINPDTLSVSVSAPPGWHFVSLPHGFTGTTTVTRTASLTRTEPLQFVLARNPTD